LISPVCGIRQCEAGSNVNRLNNKTFNLRVRI
jgi:hypothetical protein